MSHHDYLIAWLIYLVCSVGLLACFWYITHAVYPWLRRPLRVLAVVFLLFPSTAGPGLSSLSPAWLTTLFDSLLKQNADFTRAGVPFLIVMTVGLVVGVLWHLKRRGRDTA